jgi:hypothetical protein
MVSAWSLKLWATSFGSLIYHATYKERYHSVRFIG